MVDTVWNFYGKDYVSNVINGIDKSLGGMKGSLMSAAKMTKEAGAAIATIGITMKQAFEMGEQGAAVTQTAESFDYLLKKVGATPDLLEKLQTASKGTITDLKLMQSTSLLLAGTQGELAKQLANATPRLLEIAKAANKLNPALGDTTFLYDSLSRGIKRASPLILDNLGIMVSIEDANKKYAESLGKTVEQLTLEEEKIALLNAVMEQGDTMISQVGGTTDSATDSFQRMNTSLDNLWNTIKAKLAPTLANAADAITYMLTASEKLNDVYEEHEKHVRSSARSYEEYIAEMTRAFEAGGKVVKTTEDGIRVFQRFIGGMADVTEQYDILTEYEFNLKFALEEGLAAVGDFNEVLKWESEELVNLATRTSEANQALVELVAEERNLEIQTVLTAIATEALGAGIEGKLKKASEGYAETLAGITEQNNDLMAQMNELSTGVVPGYSDNISALEQEIADLYKQNQNAIDSMNTMNEEGQKNAELYSTLASEANDSAAKIYELEERLRTLKEEARVAASEGIADLNKSLEENKQKQLEALEVMKERTKEMIYQKASQGLDVDASLALARAMGILSEEDYTVVASLQALREQYDLNRDGAIEAGEGAFEYAGKVKDLTDAVILLQEKDVPITFQSIASAMNETKSNAGLLVEQTDLVYQSFDNLEGKTRSLVGAIGELRAQGFSVGGGASFEYPGQENYNYENWGNPAGYGAQFVVNYSPTLSMADAYELERLLTPIVNRIMSK